MKMAVVNWQLRRRAFYRATASGVLVNERLFANVLIQKLNNCIGQFRAGF